MTIELNRWRPSGPIDAECPECGDKESASYFPSEGGVKCMKCPQSYQPYRTVPLVLTVKVEV